MFYSCGVFAEGEVIVKSITPVYDSDSAVSVDNTKVIFNDKDQEVKYNVVLENKSNKDLAIENINLSNVSEDFLIYEISDCNKNYKDLTIRIEKIKFRKANDIDFDIDCDIKLNNIDG